MFHHVTTWKNLDDTMLNEISKTKRQKSIHMKYPQNTYTEAESRTETFTDWVRGEWDFSMEKHFPPGVMTDSE